MEQRIFSTQPGRRMSDGWSKIGKFLAIFLSIAAVFGAVGKTYMAGAQIEKNRVDIATADTAIQTLRSVIKDDHYMTCYLFKAVHGEGLPASCNTALAK